MSKKIGATKAITIVTIIFLAIGCTGNQDNPFVNTTWYSTQPLTNMSWNGKPNTLILTFYKDSVSFDLANGDNVDVATLLGGIAGGKEKHYSWNYKITQSEVILDPGVFGKSIHLIRVGDSLTWQGTIPVPLEHLALKKG